MKKLPFFEATATLVGTIIGAGILGIPFAVAKVGLGMGIILMVVLGVAVMLKNLLYAEVVLRTPHVHQLPGYVNIYLGRNLKKISLVVMVLGGYGALLAYLVGEGEVLHSIFGGPKLFWSLIFYAIGAIFVFFGLKIIKRSELIMTSLIFLITVAIGIFAWNELTFAHLTIWQPSNWIVPYGVLLFAFSGAVAIPQMREELIAREKFLPKAIILASLAVFLVYLIFTFLVLGVTGSETSEVATIGLGLKIGPKMILIGNLLAFFTMSTSFLTLSNGMKEMFHFDYSIPKFLSWLMTLTIPLVLFLLGANDFIKILGVIGGVIVGLNSFFIIGSFWQARHTGWRKPEFSLGPMRVVGTVLLLMFLFGAVLTLMNI